MSGATAGSPTPRPSPAAPRSYHFPHFERRTLANGLTLVVAPVTKLPLVTAVALVEAGATAEPAGREGVATLTAQMLLEGAGGLDGAALSERFEGIGASVEASADWDVAAVTLSAMSDRLPEALALVRDLLRAPDFPERELLRLRDERRAPRGPPRAPPRGLADDQFSRAVYQAGSRYALPVDGDTATVGALTLEDVRNFYAARYRPGVTTLVFAGDLTMDQASALVEPLFGDWVGEAPRSDSGAPDAAQPGRSLRVVAKADAPQSEVRVGHLGLSRSAPDYFDVVVMNAVLGGLFSSRINLNLREAHGYTYGAFSAFEWRRNRGPFVIHTAVKSEVTGEALREILNEIGRMQREEISEDELTLATSYLDGVFPIRYETTAAIAGALASLVIHRLPDDYYDAYRAHVRRVTTTGVLAAARTHLHPDHLRIVVVGDPVMIVGPVSEVTGLAADVVAAD
ncbi:MAG: M16 family metallopeptidase, partial [Gemmatimonadales bacterium]